MTKPNLNEIKDKPEFYQPILDMCCDKCKEYVLNNQHNMTPTKLLFKRYRDKCFNSLCVECRVLIFREVTGKENKTN